MLIGKFGDLVPGAGTATPDSRRTLPGDLSANAGALVIPDAKPPPDGSPDSSQRRTRRPTGSNHPSPPLYFKLERRSGARHKPVIGPRPNLHRPSITLDPVKHTPVPLAAAPRGARRGALSGLVNIASALTPNIRWRGHLLLDFEPVEAMRLFHALALPAGAALLLVAPYLLKRRRRAWQAAIVLMLALGFFDLLKGLDFEETAVTWMAAASCSAARSAFPVRHDPITLRSAIWRVPLLGLDGPDHGRASRPGARRATRRSERRLRETGDLLRWQPGPIHYHHHFAWIPLAVHLIEFGTLRGDRVRDLPPARRAAVAPGPGARARGRRAGQGPRHRHALVLQAPLRQAVLLQRRPARVRRLPDRERRAAALRRPRRP